VVKPIMRTFSPSEDEAPAAEPVQIDSKRPHVLQVILSRRWWVVGVLLVSLALGVVYLVHATPIYTSTSRLYVEQSGPKIISESEGIMTQAKNYLYTQCELIRSTPILAAALDKVGSARLRTFAEADNEMAYLKKMLAAEVGKKDDLINVSCRSPYPDEAAMLVNAVVDAYVTYHSQQKRSTAAEVLKILEKEKLKRDRELADKLTAALTFKQENGALSFENDRGNIIIQRLARLSDALTTSQLEIATSAAALEAIRAMLSDAGKIRQLPALQTTEGAANTAAAARHGELSRRLQLARERVLKLQSQCTQDHPIVQAAQARVAHLEEALADHEKEFAEACLAAAEHRYEAAKREARQLQASFEQQQKLAQELNVKAAKYALLKSELERSEKLCDILDSRIKEINVTEDTGALNISILEVAKAAEKPSEPRRAHVMAMALVLGLVLGGAAALLREWLDQRLKSCEEIASILGTQVLGVVPHIGGKERTPAACGQNVHRMPNSHAAEAYRTVRTAVYFGVPDGEAKTLCITSPTPGDGKSTLTSNLSIAMAQAGQRTLVIDADMRKPMQHNIFEIQTGRGLADVLAGATKPEEVIHQTDVEGLDVLPCGTIPPNPSEMLNSQAFVGMLQELSERYDRLVIDAPPVMPVTDARIVAAVSDACVLVLRSEKSTRKAAQQAAQGLMSVGSCILGAVVNDVSKRAGRYGHYGYGYGYGYGGTYGGQSSAAGRDRAEKTPETKRVAA